MHKCMNERFAKQYVIKGVNTNTTDDIKEYNRKAFCFVLPT